MATNVFPRDPFATAPGATPTGILDDLTRLWGRIRPVLVPLASLRLTVALFAAAIFLIFVGTLAQATKDINQVLAQYFRTAVANVELQVFFPPAFFPSRPIVPGSFWFPGGFSIGAALFVNLLAAHGLRFKVQARGTRLAIGLATIALGAAITWMVIMYGSGKEDPSQAAIVGWPQLWRFMKLGLAALWALTGYGLLRLDSKMRLERQLLTAMSIALAAAVGWLFYAGESAALADSSMRILWQLIEGTLAGLVLLAGCWLVFYRRAGVVLLHAGVGLMMANELVVYRLHREGVMRLEEGETKNYVEDIRTVELAVIDTSPADHDNVAVVSREALMRPNQTIDSKDLPFKIEVVKYFPNSVLADAKPGEENLATAGAGRELVAEERKPGAGADTDSKVDRASAYVKLRDKASGRELATYLFSLALNPQPIEVDGKTYEAGLRFKRTYEPYSMHLDDVSMTPYEGTTIPKDYRSKLRLVDSESNQARSVAVWMNHPLRYHGETFYQSGYDPTGKKEATTLSVVTNTGWMLPYVSCMLVVVGLLAHFLLILVRFLKGRDSLSTADAEALARKKVSEGAVAAFSRKGESLGQPTQDALFATDSNSNREPATMGRILGWAFPIAVVLLLAGWVAWMAYEPQPKVGVMDLERAGRLPVMYEGRIKPLDTLARNCLRILSGYETFRVEVAKPGDPAKDSGEKPDDSSEPDDAAKKPGKPDQASPEPKTISQPAILWLLDVVSHSDAALTHKVFHIANPDVLALLGLEDRPSHRYAASEFRSHFGELTKELAALDKLEPAQFTSYQRKLADLGKKMRMFMMISAAFDEPLIREAQARDDVMTAVRRGMEIREMHPPLAVPPYQQDKSWESLFNGVLTNDLVQAGVFKRDHANPAAAHLMTILAAYRDHDVDEFNNRLAGYDRWLATEQPADYSANDLGFESFFNHFAPFFDAWVLYIVAFTFGILAWLGWRQPFYRAAIAVNLLALAVHTFGIYARIEISGRPPVTNLYSSAVFISWAGVVFGLGLEYLYRIGVGNVVASIAGFGALLIAHMLSDLSGGDTFTVLQAVLDTNFWLATHVVCITLGYAATLMAGLLGAIYVLSAIGLNLTSPKDAPAVGKILSRMIYGVLCFAILFSFFGTVLGGLWADDSWGRFWGWDPKENGALIIVLWNALVLHARWGGMVKQQGLAALAIGGCIVTSWSWFGVNELGVGLHSYGFTEGVLWALGLVIGSQLLLIGLACIPPRFWAAIGSAHGSGPVA